MTIKEKLERIEDLFQKAFSGKITEKEFCKDLSVILTSLHTEYSYEVMVSNQNQKEKFFGMRIFPAVNFGDNGSALDSSILRDGMTYLTAPTNERISFKEYYTAWKEQKKWVLEIDAAVFDRYQIQLNPKECVAMILHELGHVVYSQRTSEVLYGAMMNMRTTMSAVDKHMMSFTTYLFYPVIIAACKYRNWSVGKNEEKIELFADKNAVEYGYGEYLQTAFQKVITKFGRTDLDTTSPDTEAKWASDMVTQLSARHNRVGQEIYIKAARSSSNYIQRVYRAMLVKLGMINKARYSGIVSTQLPAIESLFAPDFITENELIFSLDSSIAIENVCRQAKRSYEVANEAFLRKKNINRSTNNELDDLEYELDTIQIELADATTEFEKKNIIDRLYNVKEDLNDWEDRFNQFPHLARRYGERVKRLNDKLENFRDTVLNMGPTKNKRYEVFVKYPVGYEG